jgi:protocadherin Fat 4
VSGLAGEEFLINIQAKDKGIPAASSTTKVILKVAEVNLYTPVFADDMVFHVNIPENQGMGSIIATVSATDEDTGQNGLVSYYITGGDPLEQFTVDESGGWLRVNAKLDYETESNHYLNMTARDRGLVPKQITRLFTVYLSDINDSPPEFDADLYDGFVEENAHSGTPVLNMNATDADTPDNSILAYSLSGPSEVLNIFTINDTTGVIRSQGPIDYEQEQEYIVTVQAMNPGTSLIGTTQVNINVLGINEFIPAFSVQEYEFIVSESAGPGSPVGVLTATDLDLGSDGTVHYYLVGDSNIRGFALDADSGLLTIGSYVDRETMSEVALDVLAKNDGPIHGNDTSQAVVRVVVRDANDPPQFTQSVFEANTDEDVPLGSSVVQVFAVDNDILPNDRTFTYQILSGNDNQMFEIEKDSGWIYTLATLDREMVDLYILKVGAVDGGSPPNTGKNHGLENMITNMSKKKIILLL